MTESTWKILKLDWKTPGIFFFQKSENPVHRATIKTLTQSVSNQWSQ